MDILAYLHEVKLQKTRIDEMSKSGIISFDEVAIELNMIAKRELTLKKELISQYHIRKDGTPRKIVKSNRGLFETAMPDRSKLTAKTEIGLYDKMMSYYGLSLMDTSFKTVFEAALEQKEKTENPDGKTIIHLQSCFNRFIDDSFAQTKITQISVAYLGEYTQKLVNRMQPKNKAFMAYKGVLNLAFNYAVSHGICSTNPAKEIKKKHYQKSFTPDNKRPEAKILSPTEIEMIQTEIRKRMNHKRYKEYFINGYMILFSIESGCRAGELPALKWSDYDGKTIHIHSQQVKDITDHGSQYREVPYTKNEKGISCDGRYFPATNKIKALLDELKALQTELGIHSEYIFCHKDGEWIKTGAYESCLRRLCKSLRLMKTNNHAFRMSLNSNVFIKLGLDATERAKLLGHSVETNLKYYSFAMKDNDNRIKDLLNSIDRSTKVELI